jgi:hypothetical protein
MRGAGDVRGLSARAPLTLAEREKRSSPVGSMRGRSFIDWRRRDSSWYIRRHARFCDGWDGHGSESSLSLYEQMEHG